MWLKGNPKKSNGVHTHAQTHTQRHMRTQTHRDTQRHMCTHTQTHTHTCPHTDTHTYPWSENAHSISSTEILSFASWKARLLSLSESYHASQWSHLGPNQNSWSSCDNTQNITKTQKTAALLLGIAKASQLIHVPFTDRWDTSFINILCCLPPRKSHLVGKW